MIGHNGPARGAGWFALSRDMINHPVVGFGQPVKPADKRRGAFSRAEAWIWMIANASYCERQFNNKGRVQTLEPGQLVGGRSYLADEWNWSEQSVRTFLGKLQTEMMITLATDRIRNQQRHNTANIITLCNYIDYQLSLTEEQPAEQPASNQRATSEQPASNQNLTNKQINKSHTEARTREAGPNEQEVAHGIIFNCETVRHKDGYFALSIPSIEMATQGTVPRDRVEAIVKGYALQWGLEIEAGKDPKRVIPNDAMAYVSAQVRKEFTRPIDAEFKRKRGETAAQKQKADLAQAWKKVLEQEAEKL